MTLPMRYAARQVVARLRQNFLTVVCVGLVVAVFGYLLSISDGLRKALRLTADSALVIVLAEPATAESNSAISHEDAQKLAAVPGVALGRAGQPCVSCEYVVQADVHRPGGSRASAIVRGVDPSVALQVRPAVKVINGRWFNPGSDELVVGRTAALQFLEGRAGKKLLCGDRLFEVVGVIDSGGGVHESEFWGYAPNIKQAYRRTMYSSATLRLENSDADHVAAVCERIGSACVALRGVHSPAYYESQGRGAVMIERLNMGLVLLMGLGAVFAAANMMHATVASRTRELGVLRAIGFSPRQVLVAVILESLLLSLIGGAVGAVLCGLWLTILHPSKDLVSSATFSSLAFRVSYSLKCAGWSLAIAAIIGLAGGIWPARSAGRLSITSALRSN